MAGFFDKVAGAAKSAAAATGEMAKNAAEKGQDMVEITKINNRIKEEEGEIAEAQKTIGQIMLARFSNGGEIDDQIREICEGINKRVSVIDGLKDEIDRIKND